MEASSLTRSALDDSYHDDRIKECIELDADPSEGSLESLRLLTIELGTEVDRMGIELREDEGDGLLLNTIEVYRIDVEALNEAKDLSQLAGVPSPTSYP